VFLRKVSVAFFLERDDEAIDDAVILHVFPENLFHVFRRFWGIPDVVGINDHSGAVLAGVQTPGLVDADFPFQPQIMHPALGVIQQIEGTAGGTASSRVVGFSLVVTDEDVFLKSRHGFSDGKNLPQETSFRR